MISAPSGALVTAPTSRILSSNKIAPSSTLFLAGSISLAFLISVGVVMRSAFLHGDVERRGKCDGDNEGYPDRQRAEARSLKRSGKMIVHAPPEQKEPHQQASALAPLSASASSTAMRTATPMRTCVSITEIAGLSATVESISTPRFIGPGCITIAPGLANFSLSSSKP